MLIANMGTAKPPKSIALGSGEGERCEQMLVAKLFFVTAHTWNFGNTDETDIYIIL